MAKAPLELGLWLIAYGLWLIPYGEKIKTFDFLTPRGVG